MIDTPAKALEAARAAFIPLAATETIPLTAATGRVLARDQLTDRPSPPANVSSMDGYAIRLADFGQPLPIAATAPAGAPPLTLVPGAAIKIFTGAPIPLGTEAIIKREDATEANGKVTFSGNPPPPGQFIRRQGENAPAGSIAVSTGALLTAASISALAACGITTVPVRRKLRIAILTTGDELIPPGRPIEPHQIRDSNGPALTAMFTTQPWAEVLPTRHVIDDLPILTRTLDEAAGGADVVLLTGGVSMGDFDHVPSAAANIGAKTLFHKLPTRPGKPLFCAALGNKPVLGLPGNPISVLTTARWFALPLLRHLAGLPPEYLPALQITNPDTTTLKLHHFRQVRRTGATTAELLPTKGSGDIITAAASDGFVHVPPNEPSDGAFPFYSWHT